MRYLWLLTLILMLAFLSACQKEYVVMCEVTFDYTELNRVEVVMVEQGSMIDLPTPTFGGHEFMGWFKANQNNNIPYLGQIVIQKDTVLLAQWDFIPGVVEPPFCCDVTLE